jgi:hypothetical protein
MRETPCSDYVDKRGAEEYFSRNDLFLTVERA